MPARVQTRPNTEIKRYMSEALPDYIDPLTGEVNSTTLAEDACQHFDDYEGDDIPELYFEIAFEVADDYERRNGIGL